MQIKSGIKQVFISKISMFIVFVCVMLFDIFTPKNIFARGYDNSGVGIKGFAMGNAFVGIADDASAVYYNPAGLAFNEKDTRYMETYVYFTFPEIKYDNATGKYVSDDLCVLPGFFSSRTYENWAYGYGYYVPVAGGGAKLQNFNATSLDYEYVSGMSAFTASLAYKLRADLSVGAGISMYMGMLESKVSGVESEYNDALAGYGANIGLMYKPTDELSIGLLIRSEIPIQMEGKVENAGVEYDSKVEFRLPYHFAVGLGYKPNLKLTLGTTLCYMLWADMDTLSFTTAGIRTEGQTHYKNSWLAGVGAQYKMSEKFVFRAGLKYAQGSTKDEGLNPVSCDVDVLTYSSGLAYNINESTELNFVTFYVDGFEKEYNLQTFDQDHLIFLFGTRFKY